MDLTLINLAAGAFVVGFCGAAGVYLAAIAWDCIAWQIGWSR